MKYNPQNKDLSKGKMTKKAGYMKGTTLDDVNPIIDIIANGGQVHLISQSILSNGAECAEVKIYFMPKQDAS